MKSVATGLGAGLALTLTLGAAAGAVQDAAVDAPPEGLVLRAEGAQAGCTLFAPLQSTTTYLVDLDGAVVHTWESEHTPGNSVYLLDDGTLLRAARMDNAIMHGGGQGGRVQRLAPDGSVLWDFVYCDEQRMHHHDIEPLPNGNVLLVAWEHRTREEALAVGRDPEQVGDEGFWPDVVVEVEPVLPDGGRVVWEWKAWDHLIQDRDPELPGYGDVTAHPELVDVNADHRREPPLSEAERRRRAEVEAQMRALGYTGDDEEEVDVVTAADAGGPPRRRSGGDWLHTNSVDYHAGRDLVLLSVRVLSEVWVIDHSTTTAEAATHEGGRLGHGGDLLYRWGNPANYGAGTPADRRLFVQHDAQWVATDDPSDLRVTVFNNGEGRPGGRYSTVDEVHLPFDPDRGFHREPGAAFGPPDPTWTYAAPARESFFSPFISGAQRLPGGNTLICSGAQARLFEVTPAGEVVWDYRNPFGREDADAGRGGPERGGPRPGGPPRRRGPGPPPPDQGPERGRGPRDGPPPGPPGRRGGPGGMSPGGLFRATRLSPDHPGLTHLLETR